MVEAPGLGAEKLDVAVYTIRALNDLAEMAESKGDVATLNWARGEADVLRDKFEGDWWDSSQGLYADSLALDHVVPTELYFPFREVTPLSWVQRASRGARSRTDLSKFGSPMHPRDFARSSHG